MKLLYAGARLVATEYYIIQCHDPSMNNNDVVTWIHENHNIN